MIGGGEKAECRRLAVPAVEFGVEQYWPSPPSRFGQLQDRIQRQCQRAGKLASLEAYRSLMSSAVELLNIAMQEVLQADEARDAARDEALGLEPGAVARLYGKEQPRAVFDLGDRQRAVRSSGMPRRGLAAAAHP